MATDNSLAKLQELLLSIDKLGFAHSQDLTQGEFTVGSGVAGAARLQNEIRAAQGLPTAIPNFTDQPGGITIDTSNFASSDPLARLSAVMDGSYQSPTEKAAELNTLSADLANKAAASDINIAMQETQGSRELLAKMGNIQSAMEVSQRNPANLERLQRQFALTQSQYEVTKRQEEADLPLMQAQAKQDLMEANTLINAELENIQLGSRGETSNVGFDQTMAVLSGRSPEEIKGLRKKKDIPKDPVSGMSLEQRASVMQDHDNTTYADILSVNAPPEIRQQMAKDWIKIEQAKTQAMGGDASSVAQDVQQQENLYGQARGEATQLIQQQIQAEPTSRLAELAESTSKEGKVAYQSAIDETARAVYENKQKAAQIQEIDTNPELITLPEDFPNKAQLNRSKAIVTHMNLRESEGGSPVDRMADAVYELSQAEGVDSTEYRMVAGKMFDQYLRNRSQRSARYGTPLTSRELWDLFQARTITRLREDVPYINPYNQTQDSRLFDL